MVLSRVAPPMGLGSQVQQHAAGLAVCRRRYGGFLVEWLSKIWAKKRSHLGVKTVLVHVSFCK